MLLDFHYKTNKTAKISPSSFSCRILHRQHPSRRRRRHLRYPLTKQQPYYCYDSNEKQSPVSYSFCFSQSHHHRHHHVLHQLHHLKSPTTVVIKKIVSSSFSPRTTCFEWQGKDILRIMIFVVKRIMSLFCNCKAIVRHRRTQSIFSRKQEFRSTTTDQWRQDKHEVEEDYLMTKCFDNWF